MKIGRRRLRRKSIEAHVLQLLRIDRQGHRRRLLGTQVQIDLCIGIETLEGCVPLQRREAVHRRSQKAVLKGLSERDAIPDDRAGKRHSRRRGSDTDDVTAAIPPARNNILNREMPALSSSPSLSRRRKLAPVNFPYCGSYGFDMTCTDDTTSIGRLIAGLPVAGSVTFALLTSAPLCVLLAPFRLMCPSGPRTTPGTSGRRDSNRSSRLGASWSIFSVTIPVGEGSAARPFRLPERLLL